MATLPACSSRSTLPPAQEHSLADTDTSTGGAAAVSSTDTATTAKLTSGASATSTTRATAAAGDSAAGFTTVATASGGATSTSAQTGTSAFTSATIATTTSTTGSSSIAGALPTACEGVVPSAQCEATAVEAQSVPVDLFMMVDASTSMVDNQVAGVTRWDLATQAIKDFVNDPELDLVGVGLHSFTWLDDTSCNVENYATPTVAIGLRADVATAISEALDALAPGGLTPTYPALAGAIQYAKTHAAENPGRQVAVVFITDGYPTRCDPMDIPDIAELAEASWLNEPSVPVFMLGIDGSYNLDMIARGGGTGQVVNIQNLGTSTEFTAALQNVAYVSGRCELALPASDALDPDLVQLVYVNPSGERFEVPRVGAVELCADSANGGWYFDSTENPTRVTACPCSCAYFEANEVSVMLGCPPSGL